MKYILLYLILFLSLSVNGLSNDYLLEENNISAERFTQSPYSTKFQVLSQVLESSKIAGVTLDTTFENSAKEFIDSYEYNNTEFLSRKITVATLYGNTTTVLRQQLLDSQNPDGGWGELPNFASSIIDTTFALKALSTTQESSATTNAAAFLVSQQRSDGSWNNNETINNTYLTAIAMHSLWLVRTKVDIVQALEKAQLYLESKRESDGLWSEHFQSAVALIAIAPMYSDNSPLLASVDALNQAQLINQSWEHDPYTTALVLQAIAAALKPVPNPDLGSISGTVVDGDNSIALPGVLVSLSDGITNWTAETQSDGTFTITALQNSSYSLTIQATGYNQVQANLVLTRGEHKNLGSLLLIQDETSQSVVFSGVITDASTSAPLEGVFISYAGENIVSSATGSYVLRSDSTGVQTIQAFKEGYITESLTLDFKAGTSYNYAPSLKSSKVTVVQGNPYALLFGVIKDINNSLPIEGVQVLLTGTTNFFVQTDVNGSYSYEPLNTGTLNLTLVKSGYKPLTLSLEVNEGDAIEFSPYMEPSTIPQIKSIKGVVFDSIENVPLADARVRVDIDESNSRVVQTDINGNFELQNIEAEYVTITYSKDEYKTLSYGMTLTADYATGSTALFDVGQIRLRPISADIILPDLIPVDMNISELDSDPQELTTTGNIHFKIKNVGTSASEQPFKAIAFFDGDNNSVFSELNDTMVGMANIDLKLEVDEAELVTIPVNAKVPFADAYLTVLIDSNRDIIEIDEKNNNILTTEAYNTVKSDLRDSKPVVKWQWREKGDTQASSMYVYSHPIVVPLEDTNHDGLINEKDVSSVVLTFSKYSGIDGTLIALSGVDGHELWRVERGAYPMNNSLMAADLDQDGLIEIVVRVVNYGTPDYGLSSLVAYEHDGTLKWKTEPGTFQHYYLDFTGGIITDLEEDGSPEIICYGHVFDNNGVIKWSYPTNSFYSPVIATDLDLDGLKEVITDKGVYSSTGNLLWSTDAFKVVRSISIANFDSDPYPEILFHGGYSQYLFNHDGSIIWGPLKTYFNGIPSLVWGSGSITNLDFDDKPEIIMSNITLKADGSVLWDNYKTGTYFENHGMDQKSFSKYSLAFDFNKDGRSEIFSFSTEEMSILNGQTGIELVGIPSSGWEIYKYPIVADLDHDNSSEIIDVESAIYGSFGKVTVWEEENGGWAGTRGIWNQPDYYIDNINDDGTVPRYEEASWLTHNTFRVNPAYNPRKADATLSLLQLHDNGITNPYSIGVRVGNGGNLLVSENLTVNFYDGKPQEGGILLGTVDVGSLAPNAYKDITFDGITELINQEIYAVADEVNSLIEYDEDNNKLTIPVTAQNVLSTITTSTDKPLYGVNEDVNLSATITNPGRLSYALSAQLQITDANEAVVENFAPVNLGLLVSGEVKNISELWNTTTLLNGAYLLKATLFDSNGSVIDQSSTSFTIVSDSSITDLASLRLEPNKTIYHTTDTVFVESLVGNLSLNSVLHNATLELKAQHAQNNEILFEHSINVTQMAPDTLRNIAQTIDLLNSFEGRYTLYGKVVAEDGSVLATHTVSFEVQSNLSVSLLGDVSVAFAAIEPGQEQRCIYSLENFSATKLSNQPIRQILVSLESGKSMMQNELTLTLDVNESKVYEQLINTSRFANGEYTCILQAQKNEKWRNSRSGEWKGLASAAFTVGGTPAPVVVTVPLSNTSKVLLWLLMLGIGVFYLRNFYRNTGAKK